MTLSPKLKAAVASFGRVLLATSAAVYLATGKLDLSTWTADDLRRFLWAVASAAVLTGINAARKGEPRFGRGADPVPPGSDKPLRGDTPPDGTPPAPPAP